MLVVPRDGEATLVDAASRGAACRRASGGVLDQAVGRDRGSGRRSSPGWSSGPDVGRSATRCGPGSSSSCSALAGDTDVHARAVDGHGRAADAQGRGRDRRAAPRPAQLPIGSPRSCTPARSAGRPHRGRGLGRHLGPADGRGPRRRQLRHRRRRRERRSPAPPRRRPGHPRRRDRAVRLRRHDGRATAATSPVASSWASRRPRSPRRTRCCTRRRRPAVAAGVGGCAVRGGGRRRAPRSSPTPASASTSSTAPVTASAWRRTRIRTWSRATRLPLAAGSRVQRRAGHLRRRASGACASRTSSSPQTTVRDRSTVATHAGGARLDGRRDGEHHGDPRVLDPDHRSARRGAGTSGWKLLRAVLWSQRPASASPSPSASAGLPASSPCHG